MIAEALLPKLSEWRPANAGPHSFRAPVNGPWEINLTADRADTLGCALTELTVSRPAAGPVSATDLTGWAMRTSRRVTGLLEPLKVIEVDAGRSEAMLRSEAPAVRGDEVHYYELLLRGNHAATLNRYRAPRTGDKRTAIPFTLTHEAIAKLADDLTVE